MSKSPLEAIMASTYVHHKWHGHAVGVGVVVRGNCHGHVGFDHLTGRRGCKMHNPSMNERMNEKIIRSGGQQDGHRLVFRHEFDTFLANAFQVTM